MSDETNVLDDSPLGGLKLHEEKLVFPNNFVDMVALEVRWTEPLGDVEQRTAVAIRDAIEADVDGTRLQVIERVEQRSLTVVLDDSLPPERDVEVGHVLRTEDQTVVISVLPHSLAIQLSAYQQWSVTALPLLTAALRAVVNALGPQLVARIGLRYVNRIEDNQCATASDWSGKISPALIAPYMDWGMSAWVRAAREQIEFTIDEDHAAMLRHAVLSPSEYLIDVDVYSQRSRVTSVDALAHSFTRMNRTALAIFQQSVLTEYMKLRQPQEGADE